MKKILLSAMAAVMAMGFSGCNNDSDSYDTTTYSVPAFNLFTSLEPGDDEITIRPAVYDFKVTSPSNTIQVSSTAMTIPGMSSVTFKTATMSLLRGYVNIDQTTRQIILLDPNTPISSGNTEAASGARVSDISGMLTQTFYQPAVNLADYPFYVPGVIQAYAVLEYDLENTYHVRTFWTDLVFRGTTTTSGPGIDGSYTNEGMEYRIKMNLEKEGEYTADMLLYNAKFAQKAPELKVIVLKGLSVEFDKNGFTVSGENVVPQVLEGTAFTPNEKYVFNDISVRSTPTMIGATIDYHVAGVYSGSFTGACLKGAPSQTEN